MVGRTSVFPQALARARCHATGLALEADTLLGGLGLGGIHFHLVDPHIRGSVWADVSSTAHLKLPTAPTAFVEVATILPDFKPCPEIESPFDAPLLGGLALLKEALEQGA